jgi:hypothetical protein
MFTGMPHDFRSFDNLWSSKRFDELFLLLINWALDRTVSSSDEGFQMSTKTASVLARRVRRVRFRIPLTEREKAAATRKYDAVDLSSPSLSLHIYLLGFLDLFVSFLASKAAWGLD